MQTTNPKEFAFVLIPFRDEFRDLYELAIKPACQEAGAYSESVEDQVFVGDILDRIHNQIAKADIIVAVMTGRNPNVFYETGYAHALNKRVILLTQDAEDIPFDLKHFPHIIYGNRISHLRTQLVARVRWCIENPQNPLAPVDVKPRFVVNGQELENQGQREVDVTLKYWDRRAYKGRIWKDDALREGIESGFFAAPLSLGIHNPSTRVMNCGNLQISLLIPAPARLVPLPLDSVLSAVRIPDGRYVCNLKLVDVCDLYPDGWASLEVVFVAARSVLKEGDSVGIELRCTNPVGSEHYAILVKMKSER